MSATHLKDASVLVTGGSGFVGRRLVSYLAEHWRCRVHSLGIDARAPSHHPSLDQLSYHQVDITDPPAVSEAVEAISPTVVFHLAAQANVPASFADPQGTWSVNLQGTLHLLQALALHSPHSTFINVGSADMYGASFHRAEAIDESAPLAPLNPYAASKAAADLAACQYAATSTLKVIRARPFNHSGPGQSEDFALPAFAAQIACIERGLQAAELSVGDLSGERDFLHVDDVVRAYCLLAEHSPKIPSGSIFNIASGHSQAISALLERLLARSNTAIAIHQDKQRFRPVDIRRVRGDPQALQRATGWQPQATIDDLLDDLLAYWRERAGKIAL